MSTPLLAASCTSARNACTVLAVTLVQMLERRCCCCCPSIPCTADAEEEGTAEAAGGGSNTCARLGESCLPPSPVITAREALLKVGDAGRCCGVTAAQRADAGLDPDWAKGRCGALLLEGLG
eukprot:1159783-Pelagomonas_calceolata.AAC.14